MTSLLHIQILSEWKLGGDEREGFQERSIFFLFFDFIGKEIMLKMNKKRKIQ